MPRALLNFDHRDFGYTVHFIAADCRSGIGRATRYFRLPSDVELRAFVLSCHVEDIADFEISLRSWGRGSNYVQLTAEQYAKLQ